MKIVLLPPKVIVSVFIFFISLSAQSQYGPFYSKERDLKDYPLYNSYIQTVIAYNKDKNIDSARIKIDSLAEIALGQKEYQQFLFLKNEVSNFYKFGNKFNDGYLDLYNAMQTFANHADTIDIEYAVSLRLLRGLLVRSDQSSRGEEEMLKAQLSILETLGNKSEPMTNTLVDYGLYLNRKGKPNESIDLLYRARSTALKNNDLMSLAVADYTIISNTEGIDLEQTIIDVLQNDLTLLKNAPVNIPTLVYTSFFNYMLGNRYYQNFKNVDKSIEYNLKTTACLDTLQYPMWNLKSSSHSLLAKCYSDLNDTTNFWNHFGIAKSIASSKPMSHYNRGLAYITLVEAAINISLDSAQTVLDTLNAHKASELFRERINLNRATILTKRKQFSEAIEIVNSHFTKFDEIGNNKIPTINDSLDYQTQLELFNILNTCYQKKGNYNSEAQKRNVLLNLIGKQNKLYKTIVENEVYGLEISSIIKDYNQFINQSLTLLLVNYNELTDQELVAELFFSSKAILLNNNLGKSSLQSELESNTKLFNSLLSSVNHVNAIKVELNNSYISDTLRDKLNRELNQKLIDILITKQRLSRGVKPNIESISIPKVSDVQNQLDKKQGLIEFCTTDNTLSWMLITPTKISLGSKYIENLSNKINRELYEVKTGGNNTELGTILFSSSLKKDLSNLKSLVIIPSHSMQQIPFEWLQLPWEKKKLIETHTVSYNYSTALWHRLKSTKKPTVKSSLLTVAPFTNDNEINTPKTQLASNYRGFMPLPPLKSSKEEVEKITSIFKAKNIPSTSLISKEATEQNIEPILNRYNILHLATHGLVSRENPERSGLYLYPADESSLAEGTVEKNFLSLAKLQNLKLNANLAVLSACNTGIGTIAEGEGVMALPRGFIFAGVHNVIASLWRVHDEKTKDLMVSFYTYLLEGNSHAKALQLAKKECIEKGYLPIDWAGFVLIGE